MTGDLIDMRRRLRAVLPRDWFGDASPVLNAVLDGLGVAWAAAFDQVVYARLQTRLRTATDGWLDLAAQDFFVLRVRRKPGQGDDVFRARILAELLRPRVTRAAMVRALVDLTGHEPAIFEPANSADTGGYGAGGVGYGVSGGYGSLLMPGQAFVTAYRAAGGGIADVAGWGEGTAGPPDPGGSPAPGGYGSGAVQWASLAMRRDQVTDQDMLDAIIDVLPAGVVAWVAITERQMSNPASLDGRSFTFGVNTLA